MKLSIKGTIVANEDKWIYDLFGFDSTSPSDVAAALEEASGEDVTLEISSPGGDVIAANEIYYNISTYSGNVTSDIIGWAASAASYIALAANRVRMLPSAMFMIHNVSGAARGDYHAMDKESKVLKGFNKAISNAYRLKTGLSESELLSLMDKESWLTASDAKEKGFIDEIIGDEGGTLDNSAPIAIYNSAFPATIFPKEKILALKELIMKNQMTEQNPEVEPPVTEATPAENVPEQENSNTADFSATLKKSILF